MERLSLIARETINAVIITDTEGKIEWINKAFEKMSGYLLHEVANTKPGSFLQGKETNPATVLYMAEQIEKRETFECEILNYSKSGEPYWVRISGQPLFDESGNISQFFALQENITERKKIEEQVRLAKKGTGIYLISARH